MGLLCHWHCSTYWVEASHTECQERRRNNQRSRTATFMPALFQWGPNAVCTTPRIDALTVGRRMNNHSSLFQAPQSSPAFFFFGALKLIQSKTQIKGTVHHPSALVNACLCGTHSHTQVQKLPSCKVPFPVSTPSSDYFDSYHHRQIEWCGIHSLVSGFFH
jgi:hypothetical protein